MIIVARHIEGIGLNPLEYLLNEDGTEKEFESKEKAIEFLKSAGLQVMIFIIYVF